MKLYKTTLLSLLAGFASCQLINEKPQQGNELDSTIATFERDTTYRFITLFDKEKNTMPNTLFYGPNNVNKELVDSLSPNGSVPASIQCFYFYTDGKHMLFDTGLGEANGGQLDSSFLSNHLQKEQIDLIFITHCHPDHIGGLINKDGKIAFSNAEVWVPKGEYDYWITEKNDELVTRCLNAYPQAKIHVFSYADTIPMNVKAIAAPGHTPDHTVYQLNNILIAGDFMHGYDIQWEHPDVNASFDMNPVQSIESRKMIMKMAEEEHLQILGMHINAKMIQKH